MHPSPRSTAPARRIPLATLLAAATCLAACTSPPPAPVVESRPALPHYDLDRGGLALAGYDPVAYHGTPQGGGAAVRGRPELELVFRGVTYRFSTAASRERFASDPERYEPAYGGWCAWAMVDGEKVGVDPEAFLVQDGRLLLFYRGIWGDTLAQWRAADGARLAAQADQAWAELCGETPAPAEPGATALALDGADPVARRAGRSVPGHPSITTRIGASTFRFESEANRRAFLADPAPFLDVAPR